MSPITSIIITQVCNNPEYIFETFQKKGLATLRRILLLPYSIILPNSPGEIGCIAIIDIHEWHDTEIAYEFISQLNRGQIAKVNHDIFSNSWTVARNLGLCIRASPAQLPYLTEFDPRQIEEFEEDIENIHVNEQWRGTNLDSAFRMEL